MNEEFDCRPIEALMLNDELVKKLKNIFIYTVGNLQLKSEEVLNAISQFTRLEIIEIKEALINNTEKGFEQNVEEMDALKDKISPNCYRFLARIGIHRVSELTRLSVLELQTIKNCGPIMINELQSFLKQYYGGKFERLKDEKLKDNPNVISLGHLEIRKEVFEQFRKCGIYTIGDFLRMPEYKMLKIPGLGKDSINSVKKELSRLEIIGYKEWESEKELEDVGEQDGENHIIFLKDLGIKKCLQMFLKCGICTIEDYQRRSDAEMIKLLGIGESAINEVNKALLRLKIPRHIDEEDRMEVLKISRGRAKTLYGMRIYTLTELGNTSVGDLLGKSEIGNVGTEKILVEYLMELFIRQEAQEMSEIELLKRVKNIMRDIKSKTGDKKTKFKDILDKLKQECKSEEMGGE